MKRQTLLLLTALFLINCSSEPPIEGLWELHYVDEDMVPRNFAPTFIQFDGDGSFSVSKVDGDLMGIYSKHQSEISLSSNDPEWFNKRWGIFISDDELVLNDIKNGYRGEQLRFKRADKFPPFDEFMDKLSGKWQLYKINEKGNERKAQNTFFLIEDGFYSIIENEEVTEQGKALVDTRHHKITFENMDISWNVRFVWEDLRLENKKLALTYRLRRSN